MKLPQFSKSSLFLKHLHYKIKILILITISPRYSSFLIKTQSTLSPHIPLYHKRSIIQNQTKIVNMSTNSNQKFLPKKNKTKIIPSPSSSSSSLFHKFLQTQYKINVLNTVLFQSEFFVSVKVTPLFYYVPKFGLYRLWPRKSIPFRTDQYNNNFSYW